MSSVQKLKRRAMEFEQKRQLDRALELYVQLLDEAGRDLPDDDVPLYNRVGDLLMRKGDTAQALAYYERAVDAYAERGFLNNAIALCNKILRQSPGRTSIYYKLGKISARKGFRSDARKNFLEYADRMQKSGNLDEAFRALKEFAALYPEQDDIRLTLADLLSRENRKGEALEQLAALYEKYETEGRAVEARATIERMRAIDPDAPVPTVTGEQSAVQGPDTLVFLDVGAEEPRRPGSPTPRRETPIAGPAIPGLQGLKLTFVPELDEPPAPPKSADATPEQEPDEAAALPAHTDEFVVGPARDEPDQPTTGEQPIQEPEQPVASDEEAPEAAAPPDEDQHRLPDHPLSGVEFADLPLAEVQRAEATRPHDLVVPTALPQLGDPARNGDAAATDDTTEPAASEDESSGEVPAVGSFLPLDEVLIPRPEDLLGRADDDAGEPPRATYRPTPTDGERLTMPSPEELLETPPSFGRQESGNEYGFPPLPGLTDDDDADVTVPDDAFVMEDPYGRLTPIDSPSPIEFDGAPAAEYAPSGLEEPVEAPLPDGVTAAAKATNPTEQVATATPRVTLSLGGAEGHLRQRIELDPENWALHRQLGEVLLDAGDRAAGLDSLERAMSGFESAGKLEDANEVADVILRVHPNSIRHHQKRVEYAVRLKDRARLATAYLELGDALFRTGEGDKSIAVYSRVAELDPDNERALFALATLAPERVEALRGKPARRDRWSDELEALPESLATLPLSSAPPERTRAAPKPVAERPDVEDEPEPYEADQASWGEGPALVEHAAASADDTAGTPLEVPEGFESTSLAFEAEIPEEEIRRQDSLTPPSPEPISDQSSASAPEAPLDFLPLVEDLLAPEELDEVTAAPPPPPEPPAPEHEAPDTILPIEAFAPPAAPPAEVSPPLAAAPPKPAREVEPPRPPAPRPAAPEPSSTSDAAGEYIDLGDWLRDSEAPRSTRMVVEDARPTGDEQADFEELLRRFKRGLAENVDEEDFEAHYDLGVAFKEMGLVDEAIAEFQKALRGSTHRIKAYEALGACFVEKSQYPIAAALLQRAIELPGTDDQQLVGVLYLLGFASEQLGRHADALRYYQRVFAVDIDFRDVRQRVSAMEHLTK